jgi:hypothetical protein
MSERAKKPFKIISDQNFELYRFFEKSKMAIATAKIVLETCGFHRKLSFDVFFNFAHDGNLAGQRSRSLI